MTCEQVDELAAAYAIGALSVEDRQAVEAHLAGCSAHRSTFAAMRATAGSLHLAADDVEPPPGLRARIVEAARREAEAPPPRQRDQTQPSGRRWFGLPALRPSLALAAVLILGLLAWNLALQFDNEADAYVRYMGDGGDIHGNVYFVEGVGVVTVEGLRPLDGDRAYHVWAREDGEMLSLGRLHISPDGEGFVLLSQHVSDSALVFVTVEPAEGSPWPTGETVVSTRR